MDKESIKRAEYDESFEALCNVISAKRTEAVSARKDSGIEELWLACEEAYLGIDDANRHEFSRAKWAKPTSMQGPVTAEDAYRKNDPRSTAYVRLTSRYVDAGAAKLVEILLPPDDKPFKFAPTPIPSMVNDKDDMRPAVDASGQPLMKPVAQAVASPSMAAQPTAPVAAPIAQPNNMAAPIGGEPQMAPVTISDLAQKVMEDAEDCAKKAEKRIYDWMVESNYRAENRKVIHDSARIGVGVLKGPFPEVKRNQSAQRLKGAMKLEFVQKIVPVCKWVDPWNCFPDGACGENIHNGDYFLERDFLAQRQLRDLRKLDGYIKENIDKVIAEGPEKCNEVADSSVNPANKKNKNRFSVWYYYGTLTRKEFETARGYGAKPMEGNEKEYYAIITMVNDTIIRATINPLDSGRFPYDAMAWSRRAGSWAGVGIAEQVSMPQRLINAATRAMLNNAGLSAGPQLIIDRGAIEPAQQNDWTIRPNKIWFKQPESMIADVRMAFMAVEIPNVGNQMMQNIEYAFKLAEESSNIPLISQGQTGPTTPETLGATQLQNNNANTLLRSIGYSYDDFITDPKVRAYYEWLLLDPDVPEDEKGDWDINAHGSAAMVERAIQDQTLAQMANLISNPALGVDPKKWFAEWMKSKRLDPRTMQYTEEEQEKMAQTPPPDPIQVAVAKINADSNQKIKNAEITHQPIPVEGQPAQASAAPVPEVAPADNTLQAAQIRSDTELKKEQMKQDFAMQELNAKAEEAQRQRDHELEMRKIDLQIKQMELQQQGQLEVAKIEDGKQARLDEGKIDLAKTTISDQTKRELAQQEVELALDLDGSDKQHEVQMNAPSLITDSISTDATP